MELKPCPFCGGEAYIMSEPYETRFYVGCSDDLCLGFSGLGWLFETEEEAAEAWNRRAERTCRDFGGVDGTDGDCYDFACDACGYCCDLMAPNFCPNCGAKVVDRMGER